MTDALATKSKPQIRPQRRGWPTVRSRAEWRSYSLDEPGRLRPEGHRHRLSSSRWHRGRCRGRPYLLDQHGLQSQPRTMAPSSAPTSTEAIAGSSFRRAARSRRSRLQLDKKNGKLYWCDREGMRVMRCNLDGSQIETLVETGRGDADRRDQTRWCVGITIDPERKQIYWTQKGPDNGDHGRIFRAGIEIPKGETAANRSDIEVFFDRLPEPIDLELDRKNRVLYWTDRGDPPRGNTVNRASIDAKPQAPEIVLTHLMEGIGIALDVPGDRMFVTDFAGSIYSAKLDGSGERNFLYAQGNLTGIAYAEI